MISDPDARAAQVRALELLADQHRRISELRALVVPARRRLLASAGAVTWRAPSRAEFDAQLCDLADRLVLAALHLADAIDECDRARRAVLALAGEGAVLPSVPAPSAGATSGAWR